MTSGITCLILFSPVMLIGIHQYLIIPLTMMKHGLMHFPIFLKTVCLHYLTYTETIGIAMPYTSMKWLLQTQILVMAYSQMRIISTEYLRTILAHMSVKLHPRNQIIHLLFQILDGKLWISLNAPFLRLRNMHVSP